MLQDIWLINYYLFLQNKPNLPSAVYGDRGTSSSLTVFAGLTGLTSLPSAAEQLETSSPPGSGSHSVVVDWLMHLELWHKWRKCWYVACFPSGFHIYSFRFGEIFSVLNVTRITMVSRTALTWALCKKFHLANGDTVPWGGDRKRHNFNIIKNSFCESAFVFIPMWFSYFQTVSHFSGCASKKINFVYTSAAKMHHAIALRCMKRVNWNIEYVNHLLEPMSRNVTTLSAWLRREGVTSAEILWEEILTVAVENDTTTLEKLAFFLFPMDVIVWSNAIEDVN